MRTIRARLSVAVALALLVGALQVPVAGGAMKRTVDMGSGVGELAFDPASNLAYVLIPNHVAVLDASTATVLGTTADPSNRVDLTLDPAGGGVLAVGINAIERIIGATQTLGTAIPLPYTQAIRITASSSLGRAYVVAYDRRSFTQPVRWHLLSVDLATGQVLADAMIPNLANDVEVDAATGRVFAAFQTGVGVYDAGTLASLGTIDTGSFSTVLALDASARRLYSLPSVGAPVAIVDVDTLAVVGGLSGTGDGMGIAVDPARGRVFVVRITPPDPGHLEVFENDVLVETVVLSTQPRTVQVDPTTGDAWIADDYDGTLSIVSMADGPVDADADGTADDIDADGGAGTSPTTAFSDNTGDGHVTTGVVTSQVGLAATISDAPDPAGVSVDSGATQATLDVCGGTQLVVEPSSDIVVTCGSVTVHVLTGAARIVLAGGLTVVSIPAGGTAKVTDTGSGTFSVANLGSSGAPPVTITVDGVSNDLAAGTTRAAAAWRFVGFTQPIDNLPTTNRMRAGQAIPVRWRLLDVSGAPVTNLASAQISTTGFTCENGASIDDVEQVAPDGSALKNLGNGYYQLNWKAPKTYAASCRTLHLDVGDGVLHDAAFEFTR